MGFVPSTPRRRRGAYGSHDADQRATRADIARIERRRHQPQPPAPLVKLDPAPVEWWPPGTAYLLDPPPAP